ncbi:unnamed protein product [Caenorhabditis sp. 36 PRJEB53466]|nr:unnamed protein product [Caenorhabditis sp. 36 PRJEB53466]
MSLSELSILSAETAISFHEMDLELLKESQKEMKVKSNEPVRRAETHSEGDWKKEEGPAGPVVFLAVDDQNLSNGGDENSYVFEKLVFRVQQTVEHGVRRVHLMVQPSTAAQWELLVQLRIKTGLEWSVLNVVDKDVFKFDSFSHPLNVEVQTNDVKYLKIEMRVLNYMYLDLPTFTDGDEVIEFEDGSRILIHSNILAVLSEFMGKFEKEAATRESGPVIRVQSVPKEAFLELLYQAYPTRRPIYASFRRLAAAAVGFQCETLVYHLSKHIIEYNYRPMTFLDRFRAALENRLEPAIRELAFRAALDGTWDRMVQSGFEPETYCSRQELTKIVCPAILAGRSARPHATSLFPPAHTLNFLEIEEGDTSKSAILFRGTNFYVNSGLLAAHGKGSLSTGQNGALIALYTPDFHRECAINNLIPGKVFLQLLTYMHPMGEVPEPDMIRACVVFAHDHGWNIVKENLEQEFEPPTTAAEYMSQLAFADKFDLQNLKRVNIQRAESSCLDLAVILETEGTLQFLKESTREGILDRMCSGWGLNPMINRLSTRYPTTFYNRTVNLQRGKALVVGEGRAVDTLNSLASDHAFGEPLELVVVD